MIDHVARDHDRMLGNVLAWSAMNSGSRNLAGIARVAEAITEELTQLGGDLSCVKPEPVQAMDVEGLRPLAHGDNLHLALRPELPRRIMLVGHMDTVFGLDHPFQTTQWLDPQTLNGPGVADMKGGIAVMLAALRAFESSPFAQSLGVDVVLNADEEVSSLGSASLLARVAASAQTGLCFEPSQTPDGVLAGARKGSGNFSLAITGRASHAGRNPQDGRNALLAAADIALGLEALGGGRPGLTVNPARMEGGSANNVVPDRVVLRFNVRVEHADHEQWFNAAMAVLIAQVAARREVTPQLHGGFFRPPKPMDDRQRLLFELARTCGHALGLDVTWRDSGGVCDGNNLAAHGLAVIDTLGVRGGAIHSADEFLLVDSLVERAQLAALILARIAQENPLENSAG